MPTPGESDIERRITLARRSCRYQETERLIDHLLGPRDEKPAAQVELGWIAMQRQRWNPADTRA